MISCRKIAESSQRVQVYISRVMDALGEFRWVDGILNYKESCSNEPLKIFVNFNYKQLNAGFCNLASFKVSVNEFSVLGIGYMFSESLSKSSSAIFRLKIKQILCFARLCFGLSVFKTSSRVGFCWCLCRHMDCYIQTVELSTVKCRCWTVKLTGKLLSKALFFWYLKEGRLTAVQEKVTFPHQIIGTSLNKTA